MELNNQIIKEQYDETFLISGNVIIDNISEIHQALLDRLKESNCLSILIENLNEVDITFYQLILSLNNKEGIELKLYLSDEQKNTAIKLGFNHSIFTHQYMNEING